MRKGAVEGDHDFGGGEIWVYDPAAKKRTGRIRLDGDAMLIQATRGPEPLLVIVGADMSMNVHDARSGQWLRGIAEPMMTSFAMFPAR